MLTDQELRQAVFALIIIEERGFPDELAHLLREARDSTPSADPWGNATPSQKISGCWLGAKLAGLLGEPRESCEAAAAEVFAPQRQRAVYNAIVGYADELTGRRTRNTSSSPPTQRPKIRIVARREAVA